MKNDITNKVLDNGEIEMILVRLDKVDCINYNEINSRFIKWLKILNAKSFEELDSIVKGDELMEHSVEYVKRYINGPLNHTLEDFIAEKEFEATERGEKNDRDARSIEIAKNMYQLNIDIKDISKATSLSEKQIKELK